MYKVLDDIFNLDIETKIKLPIKCTATGFFGLTVETQIRVSDWHSLIRVNTFRDSASNVVTYKLIVKSKQLKV